LDSDSIERSFRFPASRVKEKRPVAVLRRILARAQLMTERLSLQLYFSHANHDRSVYSMLNSGCQCRTIASIRVATPTTIKDKIITSGHIIHQNSFMK